MARIATTRLTLENARCPRCGYDLRGEVASWKSSCPLQGRCSECGLGIDWTQAMLGGALVPLWCVENTSDERSFARTTLQTLIMTLRPWRFWRELEMTRAIQFRRILRYLVLVVVVPTITGYLIDRAMLAAGIHFVYGGTTPIAPASRNISKPQAIAQYVFLPWSETSLGLESGATSRMYPAPARVRFHLRRRWYTTGALERTVLSLDMMLCLLVAAFFAHFLCALVYLLLPVTMSRAKVRFAHIARIALYSLALLTPLTVLAAATYSAAAWWSAGASLLEATMWAALAGTPLMLVIWWGFALRRYLKLSRSWLIAPLIAAVSWLLLAVLARWIVAPGAPRDWFDPRNWPRILM